LKRVTPLKEEVMNNRFLHCLRIYLVLSLSLIPVFGAFAQLQQSDRLEIPTSSSATEQFEVFSLGEQGILSVIRGNEYSTNRNETWQFVKYDSTLKAVWRTGYKLDFRYIPVMAYKGETSGYWLFAEPDTDRFLYSAIEF
jgi:hypothetical protein